MTILDIEQVVLEDLEFERVCTPYRVECDATAEWVLTVTCCGLEFPLCTPHKEGVDQDIREFLEGGYNMVCDACGYTLYSTERSASGLWRFEKL